MSEKNIKIGKAVIGLIGLSQAMAKAASQNMADREAVDYLYQAVKKENYIPPPARSEYQKALLLEYQCYTGRSAESDAGLVVRIFGSGCLSCNGLNALLIEVLSRMELAADIEQIYDPDEIGRHGILLTPALMINGQVKSGGALPTPAQVKQWIQDVLND